jgi:ribosome maturation protein SDO1
MCGVLCMVTLDEAVIARMVKSGSHFEVLVEPESALAFRDGSADFIELATEEIFRDAKKGDRASDENLKKVFKTEDLMKIARIIVKHGDIQLTTEQRRKMALEKRRQVIDTIACNAINPQTKTPHPATRIELALDEARIHIDPFKSVEEQVMIAMKALKPLIPIRFEKTQIAVKVPGEIASQVYGDLRKAGPLIKESWLKDGSWAGLFEIPAGTRTDFLTLINKKTHGDVITKIVESLK